MNGEFNPNLVLGTPTDRESTTSHSEQHSFAIMPNDSINLSHGESNQPLSVFGEEIDIDTPMKEKKKVVKKVKKRTKSTDLDTGLTTTSEDITVTSQINVSARGQQDNLNLSRELYDKRSLPPVPFEHVPQNVYEDIHVPSVEYKGMEYSNTHAVLDHSLPSMSRPQQLDLHSSSHSMPGYHQRQLNTSQPGDTTYSPVHVAPTSVSLYDFDQANNSFAAPSGSNMQIESTSTGSPGKAKKKVVKRPRIKKDLEQFSSAVNTSSSMDIMAGHYQPIDGKGPGRDVEGDIYEDIHTAGGRRPTGPPPPPPNSYLSSPTEEPPPVPTSSLPPSPQLTTQHAWLDQIQETDIDMFIPMTSDILPSPHDNSLGLDCSIPPSTEDVKQKSSQRKSSHRKLEDTTTTNGSSSPKKPKVAKKPKYLKQKSHDHDEVDVTTLQRHMDNENQILLPDQPYETNIDDVFQPAPANIQTSFDIPTSMERKVRRMKKKSRSRDFMEQNVPLQEIWIDGMPENVDLPELSIETQPQEDPVSPFPTLGGPAASTPKPKKKKKKISHLGSDNSASGGVVELKAVDIDISSAEPPPCASAQSFHETDLDAHMDAQLDTVFDPVPAMDFAAADVPVIKKVKVVKKKKKLAKSVGDISELSGHDLKTIQVSPFETNIDDMSINAEGDVLPKKVVKKKRLNKSASDLTSQIGHEIVNVDIDITPADDSKRKKKKKKKLTKSAGDLSQTLPIDFGMVLVDDLGQPDSFYEVQTLERPRKKIKKVKKKLTRSMGDLTNDEPSQLTVVDINIDDNHIAKETCIDDITGANVDVVKKKKKKKLTKSMSDDFLLDIAPADAEHRVSWESYVDDSIPNAPPTQALDTMAEWQQDEIGINYLSRTPDINSESITRDNEHVYANIQQVENVSTHFDDDKVDYDHMKQINVNHETHGQFEHIESPMTMPYIPNQINLNRSETEIDCNAELRSSEIQSNMTHGYVQEDMAIESDVEMQEPNIPQWPLRDEMIQTNFEPGPLIEPEYVNITDISNNIDGIPPAPHKTDYTGEIYLEDSNLVGMHSGNFPTNANHREQNNSHIETTFGDYVGDVIVDSEIISSQEQQNGVLLRENIVTETPKKRKKRSKSADRARVLIGDFQKWMLIYPRR